VADLTQVPTRQGPLFLAVILEVWSRRVVGWAMDTQMPTGLVLRALEMAVAQRRPAPGLIHHSDHGSQYTAAEFTQRLSQLGLRPSCGSVGDCYDNALMESFFATLKCELLPAGRFTSWLDARSAVFRYLEGFYNRLRRHSALGYLSPDAFERRHMPTSTLP
jgi:putative transposase